MSLATLEAELKGGPKAARGPAVELHESSSHSWEGAVSPSQEVRQELVRRTLGSLGHGGIDRLSLEDEAIFQDTMRDMEAARLVGAALTHQAARRRMDLAD